MGKLFIAFAAFYAGYAWGQMDPNQRQAFLDSFSAKLRSIQGGLATTTPQTAQMNIASGQPSGSYNVQ